MTPRLPHPAGGLARFPRWVGLVALACGLTAPLAAQPSREYDLKAVFLYNFAMFVEWPKDARPPPGQPIVIGVLGRDPFGAVLDEVVADEILKGNPIEVRRYGKPEEAKGCHILFISPSETANLARILATLRDQPVLTVADMARFAASDAIITFTTDTRVQLHINPAAARKARLVISAKLLRVSTVVEPARRP
jgi:hypothetical protein